MVALFIIHIKIRFLTAILGRWLLFFRWGVMYCKRAENKKSMQKYFYFYTFWNFFGSFGYSTFFDFQKYSWSVKYFNLEVQRITFCLSTFWKTPYFWDSWNRNFNFHAKLYWVESREVSSKLPYKLAEGRSNFPRMRSLHPSLHRTRIVYVVYHTAQK